jgi:hypothetical protein
MKNYIALKYVILGSDNRQFSPGQVLPSDVPLDTIESLLNSGMIALTPAVNVEVSLEVLNEQPTKEEYELVDIGPKMIRRRKRPNAAKEVSDGE